MNIAPFKTESGVENSVQDLLFSNIEFTSQRIPFDHFEEPSSFLAYIKNEFKTLKSGFTLTDFEVVQIIYFIGNSDDQIKLDAMENLKYQIKYHRTQLSESQLSQILPIVTSMSPDTIMTSLDLLYYIVQTNCASNIEMIPFEFLDLFHEIIRNNSFPQSKPLFKSILRLLNLIPKEWAFILYRRPFFCFSKSISNISIFKRYQCSIILLFLETISQKIQIFLSI